MKPAEIEIWELKHNGVLIPEYQPMGLSIKFRGKKVKLTPEQEEMAVAWVKKLETDYVKDPVFVKNFFTDFSKALGLEEPARPEDFDFTARFYLTDVLNDVVNERIVVVYNDHSFQNNPPWIFCATSRLLNNALSLFRVS